MPYTLRGEVGATFLSIPGRNRPENEPTSHRLLVARETRRLRFSGKAGIGLSQ